MGEHINRLRTARGLRLREAARRAEVDPTWWSRLEKASIPLPTLRGIGKVARALGVDVEELYVVAGLSTGRGLPSFTPYLRAKYDLPPDAVAATGSPFRITQRKISTERRRTMPGTITTLRDVVPVTATDLRRKPAYRRTASQQIPRPRRADRPPFPNPPSPSLPRVQVERMSPAPVSGATQWSHGRWLIILNGSETRGRQRFSLAHEFKHVLDNPFIDVLYPAKGDMTSGERAEQVCDYFAACLLMPRLWLKRAWTGGEQSTRTLARHFDVSQAAMGVRLRQTGLVQSEARCEGVGKV